MDLGKILFIVGMAPFVILGTLHNVYTLKDRDRPFKITPAEPEVRAAMEGSRLRIHPSANTWRAWIGFNFSHGLGAIVFGLVFIVLALEDYPRLTASKPLMAIAAVVPLIYLRLAMRYWFIIPLVGIALGAACIAGAYVLSF